MALNRISEDLEPVLRSHRDFPSKSRHNSQIYPPNQKNIVVCSFKEPLKINRTHSSSKKKSCRPTSISASLHFLDFREPWSSQSRSLETIIHRGFQRLNKTNNPPNKTNKKQLFEGFQRVPCCLELFKYSFGLPKSMAPLQALANNPYLDPQGRMIYLSLGTERNPARHSFQGSWLKGPKETKAQVFF